MPPTAEFPRTIGGLATVGTVSSLTPSDPRARLSDGESKATVVQADDCPQKGSSAVCQTPMMSAENFGEQSSHTESLEKS